MVQLAGTLLAAAALGRAAPAQARVLQVGPTRAFHLPSQAAARAVDGDRIEMDPGTYIDCAIWSANHLLISGKGPGVVIRDRVCQDKAIFVTAGSDITIVGLTFVHARSHDRNGAGIRAEGANLTVQHTRFIDNEDGILAAAAPSSTIRIVDSRFVGNGTCAAACAHGIYIGAVKLLRVERSRFYETHVGHHIKSRALRTELIGNSIADGPRGNSSYLVDLPNGGDLLMRGNVLEKGRNSSNPRVAIAIGAEGVTHPTNRLIVSDNQFTNDLVEPTIFVKNWSETPADLTGNMLRGAVIPLEGKGTVR
jgi:nitrous oxidase accessory protein NosD